MVVNCFLLKSQRAFKCAKKNWRPNHNEKIFKLIENIEKHPFEGIGKPEALKYDLSGFWSKRINWEHRLVYKVTDTGVIKIYWLKGHY
ncbi:Txe/YoeB family addiction module toxin [Galbibacter sp.]|uniref:Txe/YoeB family addiction module toxin n=1 Tax=Galbibacter sp. TaxID=2918471 RepID=UPI003A95563C